jgi:nitroreductase
MTTRYGDLLEVLRSRRSVRRFMPEPLPAEAVMQLLDAARWAPSAGNRQSWRVLAVTNRALIDRMGEAVSARTAEVRGDLHPAAARVAGSYLDAFTHFTGAPLVLVFIHRGGPDLLRAVRRSRIEGHETAPASLDPEASALASAAAAIQNLLLAAHVLGLGACWMTGPLLAADDLSLLLDVPQGWRLTALIPVGRPAETPEPPPRRPIDRLVRAIE